MVDSTVIDLDTFSRSVASNLPAGHSWAANANRRGGEELGIQNTQAVMYALQSPGEVRTTLTADDVNMLKMALTGVDWDAGTADDIQPDLVFAESCTDVDVLILTPKLEPRRTVFDLVRLVLRQSQVEPCLRCAPADLAAEPSTA